MRFPRCRKFIATSLTIFIIAYQGALIIKAITIRLCYSLGSTEFIFETVFSILRLHVCHNFIRAVRVYVVDAFLRAFVPSYDFRLEYNLDVRPRKKNDVSPPSAYPLFVRVFVQLLYAPQNADRKEGCFTSGRIRLYRIGRPP